MRDIESFLVSLISSYCRGCDAVVRSRLQCFLFGNEKKGCFSPILVLENKVVLGIEEFLEEHFRIPSGAPP
jgi:hypothetical protein